MFGRTLKRITPPAVAEYFTDVATRQTRIEPRSRSESRWLAELLALEFMPQNLKGHGSSISGSPLTAWVHVAWCATQFKHVTCWRAFRQRDV